MEKRMFEELLESVRQGGGILRGQSKPGRRFKIKKINVQKIRRKYQLSQPAFSRLLGISVGTLRNWEQGRCEPDGPARILLGVAEKFPHVLPKVVGLAR